jgi:hypothetical protein
MATVTAGYVWASGETVTPTKLNSAAAPTVVVADNEVTTAKILDGNVTNAKLASGIDASKLTTGTLPADRIGSGAVTVARLSTGAVGTGVGFVREAASNYIIMQGPNGTKVGYAWGVGSSTSTGGDTSVTFPITFSSAPSVTVTVTNIIFGFTRSASTGTVSTTGFNYQVRSPSTNEGNSVNWIAIGPVA